MQTKSIADVLRTFQERSFPLGGCQIWAGARHHTGYGVITWNRRQWRVHVLAYALKVGPIPAGLCVCHSCDVPLCINVDHLWLGTNRDNIADRHAKGRTARGDQSGPRKHPESRPRGERHPLRQHPERSPTAKLNEAKVRDIRQRTDATTRELALEFGVSQDAIRDVLRRVSWSHLP